MARDFHKPNGLCFSPDERLLYIADTGATHREDGPRHIRVFRVGPDGHTLDGGASSRASTRGCSTASAATAPATCGPRLPTACTATRRTATLLGKVRVPEVVANLCFGGRKRNRLYICGTTSLYAIFVNAQGATWPGA